MARPKKNIEPIIGLGNEYKLTVQKSLPLFALWQSELTLAEFKILDTYLSRIDSHKPEKRQVLLTKGEIEEALGVQKINNPDLKARLKHLMGNVVEVPDKDTKKGFRLVTLFEEAEAEQDDKTGLWQVKLECTQKAMKYFFNFENLGYLRYKLRCITSLTSRYTYIMFCYLEHNRTMHLSWQVDLDKLKQILNCDKDESYSAFKVFNDRILKRVQKEMHEKTECRYEYEPVKKGRSVVAIRFNLESLSAIETDIPETTPMQYELFSVQDPLNLLHEACPEFSHAEMEQIFEVLVCIGEDKLPLVSDDLNIRRHHYLAERYAALNLAASKKPIKHRFAYFLKLLKVDAGLVD